MLVNVSELRDYVMGARMIGDICWNASKVYAPPKAADRYTAGGRGNISGRMRRSRRTCYTKILLSCSTSRTLCGIRW